MVNEFKNEYAVIRKKFLDMKKSLRKFQKILMWHLKCELKIKIFSVSLSASREARRQRFSTHKGSDPSWDNGTKWVSKEVSKIMWYAFRMVYDNGHSPDREVSARSICHQPKAVPWPHRHAEQKTQRWQAKRCIRSHS